jgi:ethanolamine utilization protein EutN
VYTGKVVGRVVATVKEERLKGIPILVVRKIENGKETSLLIVTDSTRQAGMGDHVYLIGSKEASRMFREELPPTDASIVGFIDKYNVEADISKGEQK